jgi:hypothetical protein
MHLHEQSIYFAFFVFVIIMQYRNNAIYRIWAIRVPKVSSITNFFKERIFQDIFIYRER